MMVVIAQQWEINSWKLSSPAPPTWRCHLYDPRNTFPQCSAPNFFLLPLLEVSTALFSSEVPTNKKNWKNKSKNIQEEHGQHTGTTFIKTVKRIAGGGAAPSPGAPHPPFFRPFPCCLDNDTKRAEPPPQPLSQQQQETCRGTVLTFAPLRSRVWKKSWAPEEDALGDPWLGRYRPFSSGSGAVILHWRWLPGRSHNGKPWLWCFWPFPCCFDNRTKQAEPQPQPGQNSAQLCHVATPQWDSSSPC